MSDPFALLQLPRRPLLTEDEIGSAYRRLAGKLHPDQPGGDVLLFKELGEAASILRDPSRRIRELSGSTCESQLPPKAAELFPQVGSILQQTEIQTEKQNSTSNALAKAVMAASLKKLRTDLHDILDQLEEWHSCLNQELASIDSRWPEHDPKALSLLADSYAYARRWENQLKERKLALDCL